MQITGTPLEKKLLLDLIESSKVNDIEHHKFKKELKDILTEKNNPNKIEISWQKRDTQ